MSSWLMRLGVVCGVNYSSQVCISLANYVIAWLLTQKTGVLNFTAEGTVSQWTIECILCLFNFYLYVFTILLTLRVQLKQVVILKCALVQALRICTGRTAHRGSRVIALPFHDHGTGRG
jgi:hypothetical protein